MVVWLIVQLFVLVLCLRVLWRYFASNRNNPDRLPEPPGPYGLPLPFIGYLPFVGVKPYLTFVEIAREYGDIFQLRLGIQKVVVLNSLDDIKEAFKDSAFNGRPNTASFNAVMDCFTSSVSFRTGNARWKFLRKVSIKALSMFATSRNSRLEVVVDEAVDKFHAELTASASQPIEPQQNIFDCVAGIVGAVLFGDDFTSKDGTLRSLLSKRKKSEDFFTVGSLLDSLPFGWLIMRHKIDLFIQRAQPVNDLVIRHIRQHEVYGEQENDVRDVADALSLAAKQTPEEVKRQLNITDDDIRCVAQDLFGAGFVTSMETIRWAMNLLAVNPDKQKKARLELDSICGDRPVAVTDKSSLPYNEAVLLEVYRLSSLLPFAVPHSAMEDTTLRGYFIPKGTIIYPNFYAHHHNSKIFPEPQAFKPERFLTADGTLDLDAAQLVVPFGVGPRRCAGENLARQEMLMLITRLLQQFEIHEDPNEPVNVHEAGPGLQRGAVKTPLRFEKIAH